jgi:adenine-specific DNA-methyltransferase
MNEWILEDKVHFGQDENSVPCIKRYLKDTEMEAPYSVFYQDGRAASRRLRTLMGADVFDFPKDELVLKELIEMTTEKDDIILDFFAGSGTTGHSVLLQNATSGGNRNFILVQIPEALDPDNENQKEAVTFCDQIKGPRNIATLTKERLKRSGNQVKTENPMFSGDVGFRVFKLDSTNIREWDPDKSKIAESLEAHAEHIKSDRTEQDILFELLLKLGLDLCVPIETKKIKGKDVHSIGSAALIACLAPSIATDDIEDLAMGIVNWYKQQNPAGETQVYFRDSAFLDDIAKTNLTSILNQHGLQTVRSL